MGNDDGGQNEKRWKDEPRHETLRHAPPLKPQYRREVRVAEDASGLAGPSEFRATRSPGGPSKFSDSGLPSFTLAEGRFPGVLRRSPEIILVQPITENEVFVGGRCREEERIVAGERDGNSGGDEPANRMRLQRRDGARRDVARWRDAERDSFGGKARE